MVSRTLLLLSAFLATLAASPLTSSSWDVTIGDDGSATIRSRLRNGPGASFSIRGQNKDSILKDCATHTQGSLCKTSNSFRVAINADANCGEIDVYTFEPVDEIWEMHYTHNFTGHLYGGPEQNRQYWPLDEVHFENYSMVTKQQDNQGIADPYWLSSTGYFVYVHPETSLFIEQNIQYDHYIKFISRNYDPYPHPRILRLKVTTCQFDDARQAHMYAVENFLGKPTGIPDERMITHPIWSTWARYKRDINQDTVKEFADEISKYQFDNSQLEIDDFWETCYGSLVFNTDKFPDIQSLNKELKAQGFRVTLWVHPFINTNCDIYQDAVQKGYLVKNQDNETQSVWWNGEGGAIDFTNPDAVSWWVGRLQRLIDEDGIDSFKFDAGETSWLPQLPVLNAELQLQPNIYTEKYVETVAQFGEMIEVRVAHRTQNMPIFIRMLDKDTEWDFNNGLPTLITTLLEMNMVGYPIVLPDMVGGNGYNKSPDRELFIRWLQANVFMPSIQYSYVPWDYNDDDYQDDYNTTEISKKFTKLHADYSPKIIELLKKAVDDGSPVNPPIWWIDPKNEDAQEIYDEFLLGEDILVAPVVQQGAVQRDVYLPSGSWQDGNDAEAPTIQGPTWLKGYSAPLDVLPFFLRVAQ